MTLPSSGPLSMNDIAGEFGGSTPHALNEYYAGGGLVPAGTSGTYGAVPSSGTISIQNFYGTSNFVPIYIEEVFSTWLYTGNDATQTITNNINLATNGGLVWCKTRTTTFGQLLFDTNRGIDRRLRADATDAEVYVPNSLTSYNTNGFSVGPATFAINTSPQDYVSWTFRKQPKFFDVVTWTGNGTSGRSLPHSLGSVPGCVIIKRTSGPSDWIVWHRSLSGAYPSSRQYLSLNLADAAGTASQPFTQAPSSTDLTLSASISANGNGSTYVAYIFAHDAGGFGLTGTDNVISCGSFTTDSSGNATVSLGYEPQWVMVKAYGGASSGSGGAGDWIIQDAMRNFSVSTSGSWLYANTNNAEITSSSILRPTANGFISVQGNLTTDTDYLYIAIRRGPMKTPTTGTSVFIPSTVGATNNITVGFPADSYWIGRDGANWRVFDRLRSGYELAFNTTAGEGGFNYYPTYIDWDSNSVWYQNLQNAPLSNFFLRRAPGVFDTVCYTGNGVAGTTQKHNLGAVPELMIVRKRTGDQWMVYVNSLGINSFLTVESSSSSGTIAGYWYATPTASVFYLSTRFEININNGAYVAYLFATLAGISKVGTYTGTGALQTINCGFTGGARFVLIKRTDSTGDWFVYNSANGISSGDDPYRILNGALNLVQGTNYVDTTSVGFQVTAAAPAGLNASGGTYIFLAIA